MLRLDLIQVASSCLFIVWGEHLLDSPRCLSTPEWLEVPTHKTNNIILYGCDNNTILQQITYLSSVDCRVILLDHVIVQSSAAHCGILFIKITNGGSNFRFCDAACPIVMTDLKRVWLGLFLSEGRPNCSYSWPIPNLSSLHEQSFA